MHVDAAGAASSPKDGRDRKSQLPTDSIRALAVYQRLPFGAFALNQTLSAVVYPRSADKVSFPSSSFLLFLSSSTSHLPYTGNNKPAHQTLNHQPSSSTMYAPPQRPDFVPQDIWDREMGRATSGLPSLTIKIDMLLFNPSPAGLPQDWPTDIQIDQYVRQTPTVSYRARLVNGQADFRPVQVLQLASRGRCRGRRAY
ncbi:hypothetical protein SMACR_12868 [Sordaria macrospora]|uniref:Uncharacterized protein n=1 Tax=Sordaria macrospora TaxID=5147 RepID=A0A8S8ZHF5_SORMA|nr:hypothetical protein SMACR_12868 [Sordaria macrospora]WPJ62789.1 hypothetical protein SMAC4_12868 [Sordaria macrospora]